VTMQLCKERQPLFLFFASPTAFNPMATDQTKAAPSWGKLDVHNHLLWHCGTMTPEHSETLHALSQWVSHAMASALTVLTFLTTTL
jgi:hypothetical protein